MDYSKLAKQFGGSTAPAAGTTPAPGPVVAPKAPLIGPPIPGSQPAPAPNYSDLASKFGGKTGGAPDSEPKSPKAFRFDVPKPVVLPPKEDPQAKVARLQAEAAASKKEVDKKGGFFGLVKGTAKEVGNTLSASEQALGNTIAKVADKGTLETRTQNIAQLTDSNLQLLKKIAENTKTGKDSSALKREFNANADAIEQNGGDISAYEASLPTNLQAVGQVGGVGLDILTAGSYGKAAEGAKSFQLTKPTISLPKIFKGAGSVVAPEASKVAEIASKPSGLFTKQGAKNVFKSAAVGYGYDVSQNLQAGKEGSDAFKPGAGTALSVALPVLTEFDQSIKNRKLGAVSERKSNKIVAKREKALDDVVKNNASVRKVVEKNQARGIDPKKLLADTDLLHGAVDHDGTIRTEEAIHQLNDFIKPQEDVISKNLAVEGKVYSLDKLREQMIREVDNSGFQGGSLERALKAIDDDIAGYSRRADANGNIPLATIHEAKVDKYANLNFMNPESGRVDKSIARALKKVVEDNTKSVDVKKLNGELSAHYSVLDLLEKLNGKKVKGGKLGKYFAQTLGGIAGSHFGPLGTIIGGEVASRLKGNAMEKVFTGKAGRDLKQSDAMQKAIENVKDYVKPKKTGEALLTPAMQKIRDDAAKAQAKTKVVLPAPKVKGASIQVNDFQKSKPDFIAKSDVLAGVKKLKNEKPSSLIKINTYDKLEFPSYIQRENPRLMKYLESKKNAGKALDISPPASGIHLESVPKIDGNKIRIRETILRQTKTLPPKPWTVDDFPPEALEIKVDGKWKPVIKNALLPKAKKVNK